jgi:hypothetical protein
MPLPIRTVLPALAILALASSSAARAAEPARNASSAEQAPIYDPDVIGEKAIAFYQKTALDSGRRLLLNLGTNDCAPCLAFNRAIHREKFFEPFVKQFVPANVDVSNMPNAALIDKYHINPKAPLPAVLIFMPDGRFIEALAQGEAAALAKKGDAAVQDWFLARFVKTEP